MDSLEHISPEVARAMLEWQVEMGVTDAIGPAALDRYGLDPAPVRKAPAAKVAPPQPLQIDPLAEARKAAKSAETLEALSAAQSMFEHCALKPGARNFVFSDGRVGARVMIIGEAPGREEDQQGKPFVGQAGQLLDRMIGAIGMARDHVDTERAVYITNILPWRPPHNRDPSPDEIAMMLPFVQRHVDLAAPDFIVLMGNIACRAALGKTGITRLRGTWTEAFGKPTLPMFHPAYLLRQPHAKRDAWADLLDLKARVLT